MDNMDCGPLRIVRHAKAEKGCISFDLAGDPVERFDLAVALDGLVRAAALRTWFALRGDPARFIHAEMYCRLRQRELERWPLSASEMAHAIANCEDIGRERGSIWHRLHATDGQPRDHPSRRVGLHPLGHRRPALAVGEARDDFGAMVAGELRVERCARRLRNALRWFGVEEQRVAWFRRK